MKIANKYLKVTWSKKKSRTAKTHVKPKIGSMMMDARALAVYHVIGLHRNEGKKNGNSTGAKIGARKEENVSLAMGNT